MFIEDYQYRPAGFSVSEGEHEVIIRHAEVKEAKTGKRFIEVRLDVPGGSGGLYIERYVEGEYFDAKMSRFFDAFGLGRGNFNFDTWRGRRALATFALEDDLYNGKPVKRPKIKRFDRLDKWEDGGAPAPAPAPEPANPPKDYLKGGVASEAERTELTRLYAAEYITGSLVFSKEEVERFKDMRRNLTASELILKIKEILAHRLQSGEPLRARALMDEVRAAREAQAQEEFPVF